LTLSERLCVAANGALIFAVLASVALVPGRLDDVAVVVPPYSDAARVLQVIAAADGRVVRLGRLPWIAVAHSPDPEFVARLRAAGALFVLNPQLLGGCMINQTEA
jgi:hypothetical protein